MKKLFALLLSAIFILTAIPALTPVSAAGTDYADVAKSRWSYEDVKYASDNGLMNGVGDGKFDPSGKITRGMVVTVLYRYEHSPATDYSVQFNDIKPGKWYTEPVIWAWKNGVVNGVSGDRFAPNDNVTREQLAAIMYRYAEHRHVKTTDKADIKGYTDYKKIHDYALDAMSWANAVGLVTGVTEKTLNPRGTATREQFAAIIHRFIEADFTYEIAYEEPTEHSYYTEKEYPVSNNATFYVSTTGSDSNNGSKSAPFATFEKAKSAVREYKKTHTGPITVAFFAGNYGCLETVFTAEDSGTADSPITYRAYGDGEVLFENGITIGKDEFVPIEEKDKYLFSSKFADSIYKVDLTDKVGDEPFDRSNVLYRDGIRCYEARFPNRDSEHESFQLLTEYSRKYPGYTLELTPMGLGRVKKYHTCEGMRLIGYIGPRYYSQYVDIASIDVEAGSITLAEEPFQFSNVLYDESHKTVFSNVSEELDAEDEYYIDFSTKTLYVYQPSADYVLAMKDKFIDITADHLAFEGFSFESTRDVAVRLTGDYLTFEHCNFKGIGGLYTIRIENGNNVTVRDCDFSQLAGGGIWSTDGDVYKLIKSNNLIDNCYFHEFSQMHHCYYPAIRLFSSVGTTVSHCEFRNAPHSAIILGQAEEDRNGRCIDNVIEYCIFDHLVESAWDCGSIYMGRSFADRDNIIRYNLFHDFPHPTFAIYLDDGLSGQHVYGNIFFNTGDQGVCAGGGRDSDIRGNVFISPTDRRGYIQGGDKYYEMAYTGSTFTSPTIPGLYQSLSRVPAEGTEERALWEARWPELFAIKFDRYNEIRDYYYSIGSPRPFDPPAEYKEILDDPAFLISPTGTKIVDNYAFGNFQEEFSDRLYEVGTVEGNKILPVTENPIFVNPSIGDYRIKDGADFMNIPFDEIGRY